jgi:predicted nucleic acid-binding protein
MSVEEAELILEAIEALAIEVHIYISTRPATRDADDDFVWDTVVNGQADALVTLNKRDFAAAGKHFTVPVLTPQEVLMTLVKGERNGATKA